MVFKNLYGERQGDGKVVDPGTPEELEAFGFHEEIMAKVQEEWELNREYHESIRGRLFGIRSSQISALVMVLVKEGLTRELL